MAEAVPDEIYQMGEGEDTSSFRSLLASAMDTAGTTSAPMSENTNRNGLPSDDSFVQYDAEQTIERFEHVQAQQLQFERPWFYVLASILAWVVFWDLADQNQHHVLSRLLAWSAVFVAIWVARIV